ncbi:MAG TPA: NAD(P)H-hydrate dehydratase [Candidatus Angelobacter sp.]
MRILTTDETREAEREATSRAEISTLVLMQRAGYAVAQFCVSHFKFRSVCVVCGKGNNGGDGMVAAQALSEITTKISVIILAKDASELSPDAAAMRARLSIEPIWVAGEEDLDSEAVREAIGADLIIDAIVGTGFKPPLRGLARKAVDVLNDAFATIVAVDLPSGIDADSRIPLHQLDEPTVFSHGIVTFIAPKPAHIFGELTSGPIAVSELGVQPVLVPNATKLQVATGQEVGITFPPRLRDANKGQFGHVLVIAGSRGKSGAAVLAGLAALRTGAGLVTVACPKSIQPTVAGFAPELMTEALAETAEGAISAAAAARLDELLHGKDVIVMGPGLSRHPETVEFIRDFVKRCPLPLVLDADGLNAFEGCSAEIKTGQNFRVLTPHPGETARLTGTSVKAIQEDRLQAAQRLAAETGSCVVLKGSRTVVAGVSGETWINMTGNPAMAKGGSGDVLSGIIGAALARRMADKSVDMAEGAPDLTHRKSWMYEIYGTDTKEKVRQYQAKQLALSSARASDFLKDMCVAAAVHLHGLLGDFARDMLHENTVLATDLLDNLSEAFRDCAQQMDRQLYYLQK